MARVLVTGGSGFIGSWVVDALVDAGHDVLSVDIQDKNRNPGAHYRRVDLLRDDLEAVMRDFQPEVIDHHAAQASVPGSVKDAVHDAELNVVASVRLLEAARKTGVRKIVYPASGGSTYGAPQYLPIDEKHPIDPISPYAVSKHTVEHYLRTYESLYGFRYTSLRYANVYGPRQTAHGETGVIAIFITRMLTGGQPIVNGPGTDDRDYVYVGDVARANALAIEKGDGAMVNIGSGEGVDVLTIFDELKRLTGWQGERAHGPPRPGDVPSVRLNPALAREVLGWRATTPFSEGLRDTVEWYRTQV